MPHYPTGVDGRICGILVPWVAHGGKTSMKMWTKSAIIGGFCLVLTGCGTATISPRTTTTVSDTAAVAAGHDLYQEVCAYCHGNNGQGGTRFGAPRLWGPNNAIISGAYNTLGPLTAYIKRAMPSQAVNGINPGGLTEVQSREVAQFILWKNHTLK